MISSAIETRREAEQLPSGAGKVALAGQVAQLVCDFSIMGAVTPGGTIQCRVHKRPQSADLAMRAVTLARRRERYC